MIHVSHKPVTETIELKACGPLLLVISYDEQRTVARFDVLNDNEQAPIEVQRAMSRAMQRELFK